MSKDEENLRLESIASTSLYLSGVNADRTRYTFRIFSRYISGDTILEMGPAEGVMTELLSGLSQSLRVVEGAKAFCDELQVKFPKCKVDHALFETYEPGQHFDNIILGHVLEHVDDPVAILKRAASWLNPSGRILAAVPNSRSLHRQAAVIMGLLTREDQLNDMDHHHGHRRVYNPESFRQDFIRAGLNIEVFGGYWLKPVSNGQIEQNWTPQMLEAFMQLGERYPDISGEIYVIGRHNP